jgi:sec-independent protein translocase protein TatB
VFDIAFSEIVVIAVVALVVIGPERLPKVARTLGHMFGRLQRYVNEVKTDISREMELDELRKLQSEVQTAAREFESSVSHAAQSVESGVRSIETQLNDAGAASPTSEAGKTDAVAATDTPSEHAPNATTVIANEPPTPDPSVPPAPTVDTPRQAALPGFDRI